MSQMVEFELAKILERLEQKLDNVQKDLTDIKVNQAKLQGKVEILQVFIGALIILVSSVVIKVFDIYPRA